MHLVDSRDNFYFRMDHSVFLFFTVEYLFFFCRRFVHGRVYSFSCTISYNRSLITILIIVPNNIIERQRILLYISYNIFCKYLPYYCTLRHIIAYLIRSYCTVLYSQYDSLSHCVFHKTRTSREMSHIHTTIFV